MVVNDTMGLEGVCSVRKMDSFGGVFPFLSDSDENIPIYDLGLKDSDHAQLFNSDLMQQAQKLLRRGAVYQEINQSLLRSRIFQPSGFAQPLTDGGEDEKRAASLYRDAAVNNMRFFNIFYGFKPSVFALSVNMLDRLLAKVKANSRYLSCIATCCFYIAAKTQESKLVLPTVSELVKLSQCGGTDQDLVNMERCIIEKLEGQYNGVTPFTFLQLIYQLVVEQDDETFYNSLVSSLEVIMCHHEFIKFRMETIALALVSHQLQLTGILEENFSAIIEVELYCQIGDDEFLQCRSMIASYLQLYYNRPSKLPRLQLAWSISNRALRKMKPSTKVESSLPVIMEDEDDDDSSSSSDAGYFDSECDDSELERQIRLMRLKSPAAALSNSSNVTASSNASAADTTVSSLIIKQQQQQNRLNNNVTNAASNNASLMTSNDGVSTSSNTSCQQSLNATAVSVVSQSNYHQRHTATATA